MRLASANIGVSVTCQRIFSNDNQGLGGEMKLSEEDTSKVMCKDLPEPAEYSYIIYAAQEAGRSMKAHEANRKAWAGIMDLMAKCIARGMRLAK